MLFRGLLILLGLNQTLAIALLPQIVSYLGLESNSQNLALVAFIINANLFSYWLSTGFWGKYITKIGMMNCTLIACIGFLLSNFIFWSSLFISTTPSLPLMAFSRFALGLFTSAFIILAHTHLAQINNTNLGQLAKTSGNITLGRLIGPSLVLLPVPMEWLLLTPMIVTIAFLPVVILKTKIKQQSANILSSETSSHSVNSTTFTLILISALLTTMLVSTLQLFILPLLSNMGYQGVYGSKVYASLLIYLTITVLIYQFIILPYLTRYVSSIPSLIITALILSNTLFIVSFDNRILLLIALTIFTFAISALPSWYSQKAYQHNQTLAIRSHRSSQLVRAHTTGHLAGTAISSITLYFHIPLIVPIWIFSLSLIGLMLTLQKPQHCNAPNI